MKFSEGSFEIICTLIVEKIREVGENTSEADELLNALEEVDNIGVY